MRIGGYKLLQPWIGFLKSLSVNACLKVNVKGGVDLGFFSGNEITLGTSAPFMHRKVSSVSLYCQWSLLCSFSYVQFIL